MRRAPTPVVREAPYQNLQRETVRMRRITVFDRVSADGRFADGSGGLGWAVPEPELDRQAASGLERPGTLLFGRRTFEMFEGFWPQAIAAPTEGARNPHSGQVSPEMRAMGEWLDASAKIVFSRTRTRSSWRRTRFVPEIDADAVAALKAEGEGEIMIFGSGQVVSALTTMGLIDEYRFVVAPVLVGTGRPLIEGVAIHVPLRLEEAKAYPQGNVMLRYVRA